MLELRETKHECRNQGGKEEFKDSVERVTICTYRGILHIARAMGRFHDTEIANKDPASCINNLQHKLDPVDW